MKEFSTLIGLNKHIKIHNLKKGFNCEICSKQFVWLRDFQRHTRTHTGEKPYKCGQCEKSFPRKDSLMQHMRICSKSFSDQSSNFLSDVLLIKENTSELQYPNNDDDKIEMKLNLSTEMSSPCLVYDIVECLEPYAIGSCSNLFKEEFLDAEENDIKGNTFLENIGAGSVSMASNKLDIHIKNEQSDEMDLSVASLQSLSTCFVLMENISNVIEASNELQRNSKK